MGKESEILQAAQDGNLSKLESLFTQKRFGGLLKGPNINARDDSGCTALHLCSLNGHKDVVIFLLHNDASANIPDNAGSYPLHLAAFNGHHEIANTLITRGPSRAQVNEANMAGDTPLHVAAQYGHENVVKVLLSCHADATSRNSREESALDLAAQYGRNSTVELFLTFDKTLCYKDAVHKHSPIHLAARNGHTDVVCLLLDNGMPVNATCDMGTALHCAALFGKVAIAKLLLERGIDIEIEDDNGQKVLDLLVKHPSKRAQEITALIYATPTRNEMEMSRSPAASYSGQQFKVIDRYSQGSDDEVISKPSGYDIVPPPRPKPKTDTYRPYSLVEGNATTNTSHSDDENNFDLATTTPLDDSGHLKREKFFSKKDAFSSSPYSLVGEEVSTSLKSKQSVKQKRTSKRDSAPAETEGSLYTEISPATQSGTSGSKKPNPFQSSKPLTSYVDMGSSPRSKADSVGSDSLYQVPLRNSFRSRDSVVPDFPPPSPATAHQQVANIFATGSGSDNIYQAPVMLKQRAQTLPVNIEKSTRGATTKDVYDNVNLQSTSSSSADIYDNVQLTNSPVEREPDTYDNVHITNKQQQSPMSRTSSSMSPQNTNDMYYQQPPNMVDTNTADSNDMYYQAPPSSSFKQKPVLSQQQPVTTGIKQTASSQQQYTSVKTRSMKQKRTGTMIKRDISLDDNANGAEDSSSSISDLSATKSPAAADNQKQQPDNLQASEEEKTVDSQAIAKAPEQNILKGSSNMDSKNDITELNLKTKDHSLNTESKTDAVTKKPSKTEKEEEDNKEEETPIPKPRTKMKQSRTLDRSVESGYRMAQITQKQPLDETYEWNKIDAFLNNLEQFAGSPTLDEKELPKVPINSVSDWLESLGLSLYEPMLVTNGFDEIDFINGSLDDQDLIELGILHSDHRKKILESAETLSKVPVIGEDGIPIPSTLSQWLNLIKLEGYQNRFNINGYGNMDRVRVIWELELVTVLDVNAIGHRKRMLTSLGRKPLQIKAPVSWAQRFADAEAGKVKNAPLPDDSMELAQKLMETAKGLSADRNTKNAKQPTPPATKTTTTNAPQPSTNAPPTQALDERNKENNKPSNTTAEKRKSKHAGWLHTPDILLYESVAYTSQYLGSHPVQKVKGVESTLDACSKMKVLSQNVHKMPSIVLSISVRGIDYIDSNSKMIINSYSINHISFCAQDPNNLNVFAYITRDELTRKNYCHVFKAQSTRQADEIILTLGQCFEVAYQQHLALLELKKAQVEQEALTAENVKREPPPPPTPYAERTNK